MQYYAMPATVLIIIIPFYHHYYFVNSLTMLCLSSCVVFGVVYEIRKFNKYISKKKKP